MFIRKSQSKEFEKWIENLLINESLRNKISDWILKSPIEIGIRKFPSYSSSFISAGWMTGLFYNGYILEITARIDYCEWINHKKKEYDFLNLDSEIIKYFKWIKEFPTHRIYVDKKTLLPNPSVENFYKNSEKELYRKKVYKRLSVVLLKEDMHYFQVQESLKRRSKKEEYERWLAWVES